MTKNKVNFQSDLKFDLNKNHLTKNDEFHQMMKTKTSQKYT